MQKSLLACLTSLSCLALMAFPVFAKAMMIAPRRSPSAWPCPTRWWSAR